MKAENSDYHVFEKRKKIDKSSRKQGIESSLEELIYSQVFEEYLYENIKGAGFLILMKVLQFNKIDCEKYFKQI